MHVYLCMQYQPYSADWTVCSRARPNLRTQSCQQSPAPAIYLPISTWDAQLHLPQPENPKPLTSTSDAPRIT